MKRTKFNIIPLDWLAVMRCKSNLHVIRMELGAERRHLIEKKHRATEDIDLIVEGNAPALARQT